MKSKMATPVYGMGLTNQNCMNDHKLIITCSVTFVRLEL